ncbi:MAG: DNA adenine methylase [Verrucomicrobiia bacterium]
MAKTISPLRYPGGKSCLYDLVSTILRKNRLERGHYVEPYAGGAGLALSLLYEGHVSDIHINDLDISIWSFWECVLNRTEELVELVEKTPITIKEWHRQKQIHATPSKSNILQLAFATFFLNRTNRSGIIKGAGVIGGKSQTGNYKLDCRFNRQNLVQRIRRIAKYRNRIHLTNLDAINFMQKKQKILTEKTFFCIDPPYFNKGSYLYTNYYSRDEHKDVAKAVLNLRQPWIVTYDYTKEIKALYLQRRQFLFDINYSIQTKRVGTEILIASKGLLLPEVIKHRKATHPPLVLAA